MLHMSVNNSEFLQSKLSNLWSNVTGYWRCRYCTSCWGVIQQIKIECVPLVFRKPISLTYVLKRHLIISVTGTSITVHSFPEIDSLKALHGTSFPWKSIFRLAWYVSKQIHFHLRIEQTCSNASIHLSIHAHTHTIADGLRGLYFLATAKTRSKHERKPFITSYLGY